MIAAKRIARLCDKCKTRVFGNPGWVCPAHPGSTRDQRNRPYMKGKK